MNGERKRCKSQNVFLKREIAEEKSVGIPAPFKQCPPAVRIYDTI